MVQSIDDVAFVDRHICTLTLVADDAFAVAHTTTVAALLMVISVLCGVAENIPLGMATALFVERYSCPLADIEE